MDKEVLNLIIYLKDRANLNDLENILSSVPYKDITITDYSYMENALIGFFRGDHNLYNTFGNIMVKKKKFSVKELDKSLISTASRLVKFIQIHSAKFIGIKNYIEKPFYINTTMLNFNPEDSAIIFNLVRGDFKSFQTQLKKSDLLRLVNSLIDCLDEVMQVTSADDEAFSNDQINDFFNNVKRLMITIHKYKNNETNNEDE